MTMQKNTWQLEQYRSLCSESSDVLMFLAQVMGGDERSEEITLGMGERAGLSYILHHFGARLMYAVDGEFQTFYGTEPVEYSEGEDND